jgi:hypothetical protein
MPDLFTNEQKDALRAPHVARATFAMLDLPSGIARYHNGVGTVVAGGYEWQGVTDPIGGRLLSMTQIEEPRFGSAVSVQFTLSGVDKHFFKSVYNRRRQIEGREARIYYGIFDAETQEIIGDLIDLFGRGHMTSPALHAVGLAIRTIELTIESQFASANFAPLDKWSATGQQRRFPGDLGGQYIGVPVEENWI